MTRLEMEGKIRESDLGRIIVMLELNLEREESIKSIHNWPLERQQLDIRCRAIEANYDKQLALIVQGET